ncbi:MAG: hypothetical protein ACE5HE_03290 [Phycisphaerae bacterium]
MPWMTQAEAAAALGCSIRTIRRRIRRQSLTAQRQGRNVLVNLDVDATRQDVPLARHVTGDMSCTNVRMTDENADTLSALADAVRDNLSVLSDCRRQLENNSRRTLRSKRCAWLLTGAMAIGLLALGWLLQKERLDFTTQLRNLRATAADREARLQHKLEAAQARHEGETDALWLSLTHAHMQTDQFHNDKEDLLSQSAALATQLDRAQEDRERLGRERDALAERLRHAEEMADLAETLRAAWQGVVSAVKYLPSLAELTELREAARQQQTRHERDLEAARARYQADLALVRGRHEGETAVLQASLEHERQTTEQLEERLQKLADRVFELATDRGRLRLEQVRLEAEIEKLTARLQQAPTNADPVDSSTDPVHGHAESAP